MGLMHKALSAVLILAVAVGASPASQHPVKPVVKLATPPPTITTVTSRPFCSALRNNIGPAIGTLLQNDNIIRVGPKLLSDYNRAIANGENGTARKDMTLLQMENMVGPLVGNVKSIQKALEDPAVFHDPPRTADEKRLLVLRDQILAAVAMQNASLDIVNGLVTTAQLGEIQHEGEGIVSAINGDVDQSKMMGTATPNPLTVDPNAAGLPQDTHFIDPTTIPGLSLGYNPITRLNEGLKWTIAQANARENATAPHVMDAVRLCGGVKASPAPAATAAPTATP
jgi:hypothetical protein